VLSSETDILFVVPADRIAVQCGIFLLDITPNPSKDRRILRPKMVTRRSSECWFVIGPMMHQHRDQRRNGRLLARLILHLVHLWPFRAVAYWLMSEDT